MKNKGLTIFLICLFSILIIFLSLLLILVIKKDFRIMNFNFSNKVSNNILFEEIYQELPNKIKVKVNSADILIKNSSDDNVHIKIYADKEKIKKYDVDTDNGLNISVQNKNCIGFCFNIIRSKVIIYLPSNYDKELILNNNYGDIEIDSFENLSVTANLDAGDIDIKKVNIASIDNNYGDISIDIVNKASIKESCGDVSVNKAKNISVINNYGDINIKNVTEHINLENNCGDIDIENVILTQDSKIKSDLGDITIDNIKDVYIDAKTSLGDINIRNNDHKSGITLTIKNSCGDINVND